jgi:limonene-1,2-epoxide hydrolase
MDQQTQQSEVARLLSQIEAEYLAATRGLSGFAATAKHAALTARMERMGQLHQDLHTIVGNDAIRLIAERLDAIPTD